MRRLASFATFLLVILATSGLGDYALGYEVETHRLINRRIYAVSALRSYFDAELNLPLTDSRTFQGQVALVLMREGGYAEDSPDSWCYLTPYPRAYNHYHDPIRSWEEAGYTNPAWYSGISGVLYAQYNRLSTPPNLSLLQCPVVAPNDWTWDNAYQYFRDGLRAPDEATRNQNLANLFTSLGHLTHLVTDVSVPEHSRNDAHVIPPHYETWCAENLTDLDNTIAGLRVFDNTLMPHPGLFAQGQGSAFASGTLSPVSNLWDSRSSGSGYNPLLSGTERLAGLADYSNYNYFSGGTAFNTYDYPAKGETGLTLVPVPAKDGQTDYALYFNRTASDGIVVKHLAAAGLLYSDLEDKEPGAQYKDAHLDPLCWEDYASNLVPRAVSYGTALVDYFFRGKFHVTPDGNTVTVTNLSPGTVDGSITIYADDVNGVRTAVSGFIDLRLAELAHNGAIAFGAPTRPVSRNDSYTLVFTGLMENTGSGGASTWDNLVAGKVFSWPPGQPSGAIVNGGFETGDFTGWVTGGDYNERVVSAVRPRTGSFSASMGRWDNVYPAPEAYGWQWMYQDFTVPGNATVLKFSWWMQSWDTAWWDGFYANLLDTNGSNLKTLLYAAGRQEYQFGTLWTTEIADGGTGWREVSVDVSAWRGQTIRLQFWHHLDGNDDQERVFIDDVTVQ